MHKLHSQLPRNQIWDNKLIKVNIKIFLKKEKKKEFKTFWCFIYPSILYSDTPTISLLYSATT